MRYYVKIYTYVGVAIGASHWWAVVEAGEGVEKVYDSLTKGYKSRESALRDAVNWFKREAKEGDFLLLGEAASCDPMPVLCGPGAVKKAANGLQREAEKIGRWEGDEREMQRICDRWEKLWEGVS